MHSDWATHPGEHLAEYMEIRGWDAAECARRADLREAEVEGLLARGLSVTPRIADALGFATTLPAPFWLRIQEWWDAKNKEPA